MHCVSTPGRFVFPSFACFRHTIVLFGFIPQHNYSFGQYTTPSFFTNPCHLIDREESPTIIAFPEDKVSNPGGSLNLTCAANGKPFPMVRWKKGENYIDENSEFPGRNTLELTDIRESATYTCEAVNSVASITKDVTVTMLGRYIGP